MERDKEKAARLVKQLAIVLLVKTRTNAMGFLPRGHAYAEAMPVVNDLPRFEELERMMVREGLIRVEGQVWYLTDDGTKFADEFIRMSESEVSE